MRDRHLIRPSGDVSASAIVEAGGGGGGGGGGVGIKSAPRPCSAVVGLIPPSVHSDLTRGGGLGSSSSSGGGGGTLPATTPPPTGRVDPNGSGLAAAVVVVNGSGNDGNDEDDDKRALPSTAVVSIWAHSTQTLSEDLIAPERVARFVHPEPFSSEEDEGENGRLIHAGLIAVVPYGGAGVGAGASPAAGSALAALSFPHASSTTRRRFGNIGGASAVPPRSLYVCGPSGVLCLWNDALQLNASAPHSRSSASALGPPPECDAACRIPLGIGEYVTTIESLACATERIGLGSRLGGGAGRRRHGGKGGGNGGGGPSAGFGGNAPLIVGTSAGGLWMCVRTNLPLQIRARPLRGKSGANRGRRGGDGQGRSSGRGGGTILGWLLGGGSDQGAPSTGEAWGRGDVVDDHDDDNAELSEHDAEGGEGGAVVAILPLPSIESSPRSYPSSYAPYESPRKAARTRLSAPMSFLVVSSSSSLSSPPGIILSKWTLSSDEYHQGGGGKGGGRTGTMGDGGAAATGGGGGSHHLAESLDYRYLLSCSDLEQMLLTDTDRDNGARLTDLEPLRATTSHPDGRRLVVAVKAMLGYESNGTNEEGRLYLVWCSLIPELDAEGNERELCVDGAKWLDRYSSDAALGGSLECAGLVVRRGHDIGFDEEGEGEYEYDENGQLLTGDMSTGEYYVAYSVWHDPNVSSYPTVVSSVRFGPANSHAAQSCDVDLPPDVVPSVLAGAVAPDAATDGIVLIGRLGCVANFSVDFPIPEDDEFPPRSARPDEASGGGRGSSKRNTHKVSDEDVQSLASHLLSAYAAHLRRVVEYSGTGGGGRLRRGSSADPELSSSLPPSIFFASTATLSAASVAASSALVDRGDPTKDPSSRRRRPASSPSGARDALVERMDVHSSYVNFLVHAGAYRRIGVEGRRGLRDGGEMLAAALAVSDLMEEDARAAALRKRARKRNGRESVTRGEGKGGEMVQDDNNDARDVPGEEEWRSTVAGLLLSLVGNGVTALPTRLAELQATSEGTSIDSIDQVAADSLRFRSTTVNRMSSLLCTVLVAALRYREDESDVLYDISVRVRVTTSAPWTSDPNVLTVLMRQLELLGGATTPGPDKSGGASPDEVTAARIRTLSSALLDGHADLPPGERNEALYDGAKRLVVPLIRTMCRDDELALRLSVEHGHFEGVVVVCHDNWSRVRGAAMDGDGAASSVFDLAPILEAASSSSVGLGGDADIFGALRSTVDFRTDLSFPRYVLKWYADRGMYGTVLDYGRHCDPEVLASYLEMDERLAPYRWIQDVRMGRYDGAAGRLLSLANTEGGLDLQATTRSQSLDDRRVALSLGILADSLSPLASGDGWRKKDLRNGLLLAQIQEELRGVDPAHDVPFSASELVDFAAERADASKGDIYTSVNVLLAGLAAAGTLERDPAVRADAAARIWATAVRADLEVWAALSGGASRLGKMPEDEWSDAVGATLFFRLASDFAEHVKSGGTGTGNVGYRGNDDVQERVLAWLSCDDKNNLLETLRMAIEVAG